MRYKIGGAEYEGSVSLGEVAADLERRGNLAELKKGTWKRPTDTSIEKTENLDAERLVDDVCENVDSKPTYAPKKHVPEEGSN